MSHNSLSPAFVKINYSTPYGVHVMTVPSVPIQDPSVGETDYRFTLRGAALPVPVQGAVEDYCDQLAKFMGTDCTFNDYIAYRQPDPDDVPTPVESGLLNISGVLGTPGWDKAVQETFTFRADDFTLFKIVLLDAASGNNFNKVTAVGSGTDLEELIDYVTADVTWLASRGGGRPDVFLQLALTLNEKLRRAYNMN